MPISPTYRAKENTMNKIVMAEIQKDLSCEQRAPARALQCFPNLYSVRPVPPHRCNCDEVSPVPPTFLASSRALPGERVSPFQTEIWSRPAAPLHGLTLTTMSLHTMSVICSEIEETDSIIVLSAFCWSAPGDIGSAEAVYLIQRSHTEFRL